MNISFSLGRNDSLITDMSQKINTLLLREVKEMFDADQELRNLWNNPELKKPLNQWGNAKQQAIKGNWMLK